MKRLAVLGILIATTRRLLAGDPCIAMAPVGLRQSIQRQLRGERPLSTDTPEAEGGIPVHRGQGIQSLPTDGSAGRARPTVSLPRDEEWDGFAGTY